MAGGFDLRHHKMNAKEKSMANTLTSRLELLWDAHNLTYDHAYEECCKLDREQGTDSRFHIVSLGNDNGGLSVYVEIKK